MGGCVACLWLWWVRRGRGADRIPDVKRFNRAEDWGRPEPPDASITLP